MTELKLVLLDKLREARAAVVAALDVLTGADERQAFLDEYAEALDAAYPREPHGVVLGFRRIFAVGHKPG